jgi:hypothetical protein
MPVTGSMLLALQWRVVTVRAVHGLGRGAGARRAA